MSRFLLSAALALAASTAAVTATDVAECRDGEASVVMGTDQSALSTLANAPTSQSQRQNFMNALAEVATDGFEALNPCNDNPTACSDGDVLDFGALGSATISTTGPDGAVRSVSNNMPSSSDRTLVGSNSFHLARGGGVTFDFGPAGVEAVGFYLNDHLEQLVLTVTCVNGDSQAYTLDANTVCGKSRCDDGTVSWWSTIRKANDAGDRCRSITIAPSNDRADGTRIDEVTVGSCAARAPPARQCTAKFGDGSGPTCTRPGAHALTFTTLGRFVFDSNSGRWTEFADGTAELTGVLVSAGNIDGAKQRFAVSYLVGARISTTDLCANGVGNCGLKFELWNSNTDKRADDQCYVMNGGGPVDATTWFAYPSVLSGVMTGIPGTSTAGTVIVLKQRGPPLTVGFGAGNKNVGEGVSSWFDFRVAETGAGATSTFTNLESSGSYRSGDINIDLTCDAPLIPPCDCYEVDCGCTVADASTTTKCVKLVFVDPTDTSPDCNARQITCPF